MPIQISGVQRQSFNGSEPPSEWWLQWFRDLRQRVLDSPPIQYLEVTITASELDGGLSHILKQVNAKESYKVKDIILSGSGTNFGAGGDRNIAIQDTSGTSIWTVIPNATIESLTAGRWGSTQVPFPATASHIFQASTVGENIIAKYSGGTTDHTTGSLSLLIVLERVA